MLLCVQSKKVSSSFIKILPAVLVVNYLVVTVPKFLLMVIYSSLGGDSVLDVVFVVRITHCNFTSTLLSDGSVC